MRFSMIQDLRQNKEKNGMMENHIPPKPEQEKPSQWAGRDEATPTLDAAMRYADLGFSVIPVVFRGKLPAVSWKSYQSELASEGDLETWFAKGRCHNIGIVTGAISGLIVVDADSDETVAWAETNLPHTPTAKTARGRHYYFRYSPCIGSAVKAGGRKLDIRSEGSFVVAPPSIHSSGASYTWVEGRSLEDLPLADFPGVLMPSEKNKPVDKPAQRPQTPLTGTGGKYGQAALANELDTLARSSEGKRNDQLNRAAFSLGQLVAGGEIDQGQVVTALLSTAESIGLTRTEAHATIKSGLEAGTLKPRTAQEPAKVEFTDIAAKNTERRFKLVRAGTLEATAPQWIVRDLIERDALALVFGDPGCGKSFWALDLALCVATGTPHHGHNVEQGPVVYIAGEGHGGIKRRLMAWSMANGVDHDRAPLFLSRMPAALTDAEALVVVLEAIMETAADVGPPVFVVVDTVARNFGPADENSTADMGRFIQAADIIRAQYRSTVLLVHHSGHADKTRARGAIALKGALDAEYRMDKGEGGIIRLEATKMKEADLPEPMAFYLRGVDLLLADSDTGEVVSSAALAQTNYEPRAQKGKQGRGKHQIKALEILADLYADGNTTRVSMDDWKEAMHEKIPPKRIKDVVKTLCDSGAVCLKSGFIYLV